MAGIVSPLVTDDDVGAIGQKIDNLSFALVTPLGAQDDQVRHAW